MTTGAIRRLLFICAAFAAGAAHAQPVLTSVEATPDGYALNGRGFGTDRAKLELFEGAAKVAPNAILAHTDMRITVRASLTGTVQHRVVVGGRASGVISFPHAGAPSAAARKTAPAAGPPPPRRFSASGLSATGWKSETPAPRRASLGALSATGYKEAVAPPRRADLGAISAEGWR